jgi:hypothetical protein
VYSTVRACANQRIAVQRKRDAAHAVASTWVKASVACSWECDFSRRFRCRLARGIERAASYARVGPGPRTCATVDEMRRCEREKERHHLGVRVGGACGHQLVHERDHDQQRGRERERERESGLTWGRE